MAKKNDHLADFATENTGGVLSGFLADEEHLDRRAMLRLGTWGAASVGAIIVALLANQSSLRLRHDELAAADLSRQAQQIQSVARESQNETRRLASAIDTLNGDRDRVYSRLSTLEQGLDSVTGAIARQSSATAPAATPTPAASTTPSASSAPTAAAPATPTPQPVADGTTPAPAPDAAATEPAPLIGPVATTTAVITGKQAAEAKRRDQANAKMAAAAPTPIPAPLPAAPAPSNQPATTAAMPLVSAKSMMGPPDPAAPKLIEPEPAKVAAATASPATPQAAPPTPAAQTAQATPAAAPESAAATRDTDKVAANKPVTDKPATEKTASAETAPQASPQLAVNRTEFGVDVGGANSVGGLRALWRGLLKSRSNASLAALQPIIVIKEGNNGLGMQLRLVAGPLTDAAAAAKICASMVENERPCATTVYDGQHLAMKVDDVPASTGTISPKTERSSETPETEKPAAEKPAPPKSVSGRQTWRRHSYQRRTAVEEPPAEKPKSTTASTISSFFHRSN
jgi:hypothetical protein